MGRRGPPPKPARVKLLEGNPGKRPLKGDGPKPQPVRPTCPDWLTDAAKAEWRRLAPELQKLGLLTLLDRAAFAGYCQSYGHWLEAETVLRKQGRLYVTPSGRVRERPEVEIARKSLQLMRAFAVEFGLSPTARGRMSLPAPIDDEDDEFERLLD